MVLCGKCGATFNDDQAVCPACGAPAGAPGQQAPGYQAPPPGYQAPPQGYQQQGAYVGPDMDVQNNKAMGILAYLGFLFLVPLLAAKESPFARYHANQGLVLFLMEFFGGIAIVILSAILVFISPVLGVITFLLYFVVYVGAVVLMIIGIMNAAKGEMKPLPLIGGITLIK